MAILQAVGDERLDRQPGELVERVAEHRRRRLVDEDDLPVGADHQDGLGRVQEDVAETELGRLGGLRGTLLLGDVVEGEQDEGGALDLPGVEQEGSRAVGRSRDAAGSARCSPRHAPSR